jgi:hypothetical protein
MDTYNIQLSFLGLIFFIVAVFIYDAKNLSMSGFFLAIILSCIFSMYLFGTQINATFFFGTLVVVLSVIILLK